MAQLLLGMLLVDFTKEQTSPEWGGQMEMTETWWHAPTGLGIACMHQDMQLQQQLKDRGVHH